MAGKFVKLTGVVLYIPDPDIAYDVFVVTPLVYGTRMSTWRSSPVTGVGLGEIVKPKPVIGFCKVGEFVPLSMQPDEQ